MQTGFENAQDALRRADQLRLAGRMNEAEQVCRSVLQSQPATPWALNYLALLLSARGAHVEAEDLLRRATAIAPGDAALHSNLGNILRQQGKLAEAEQSYRSAIDLKPDYPEAHYNRGITLRELGQRAEAYEELKSAARLKPDYVQALSQIGSLLAEEGVYADALRVLDTAVAIDPKSFEAHYIRSAVLTALERTEDAIGALKMASALEPKRHEPYFALGNAYVAILREELALDAYSKAIEAKPDFIPAHLNLNTLAWSLGKGNTDLASFTYARGRIGEKPELLVAEGELRLQRGEFEAAEAVLAKAHHVAPERSDAAAALGRAVRAQGRLAESVPLFQKAVARDPSSVKHRQDLAVSLMQDSEFHLARRELEQAFALAPFDQLTLAYLTLAYRSLGDSRYEELTDLSKFVRIYELPVPAGFRDVQSFHDALAEELVGLHTQRVAPLDQTLQGGTQTTGYLFSHDARAIELVRENIRDAVARYIREMPDVPGHPVSARKSEEFSFSGAWSCRLQSSGFHTNHVHPEGWISSAYYVSLPDAVEDVTAQKGWLTFGESNLYLGDSDRIVQTVKPAVGRLVLFPSYFWHGTVPFESDRSRLSIAFDVVPGKVAVPHPGMRNSY